MLETPAPGELKRTRDSAKVRLWLAARFGRVSRSTTMSGYTRRQYIGKTTGGLAGAGLASSGMGQSQASPQRQSRGAGIQLALMLAPGQHDRFRLARQIGVDHAIVGVSQALSSVAKTEYAAELRKIKAEFDEAGLTIAGVESHPVPAEKIKLGLVGRDARDR